MTATAAAPATLEELPQLREVSAYSEPSVANIAAQYGCDTAAIVQLFPFFVGDDFVTVLASATKTLRSAELLTYLEAGVVRPPRAQEILLSFQLSQARPHRLHGRGAVRT